MRTPLRAGFLIGTLLMAPMVAAIPASAISLEPAESAEQVTPIWQTCPTPTLDPACYLVSLSASGSGRFGPA
ncbi:hypothetical protein ACIBG0_38345 [Nocardia sp. NPDC050630]|uniref:hypothetical protein n=1 Tax=Nocardia sp. NPDC050630 TaxID=3364321 RepID=UPI00379314FE